VLWARTLMFKNLFPVCFPKTKEMYIVPPRRVFTTLGKWHPLAILEPRVGLRVVRYDLVRRYFPCQSQKPEVSAGLNSDVDRSTEREKGRVRREEANERRREPVRDGIARNLLVRELALNAPSRLPVANQPKNMFAFRLGGQCAEANHLMSS